MPHDPVLIHEVTKTGQSWSAMWTAGGHAHDFGCGINCSGVMDDNQVRKFYNK